MTRNVGIDNSKRQYIMFVDSDDYIEKKLFVWFISIRQEK